MLPKDFRGYLDYLEKKGKLLRVKKPIDVKYEIAAGIRKISDNDGPALLFENVKGYPGWRVAGGIFGTKKLTALAMETPPDEEKLVQRFLECDEKRVKPKLVSTGPVKEIIIKGDDVDLTKLPVVTYCEKDAGPFIIGCASIAKHPETGIQNVTIDRGMILSKNTRTIVGPLPQHHGIIFEAGEKLGRPVGVATVLGAPPELSLASQVRAPMGVDEIDIAGAFRGEPLEVVKCETIDVEVPAYAEVIIEQETIPGAYAPDGPFGEYPGDYISLMGPRQGQVPVYNAPVLKVKAITMRKNPIWQAMLTGMPMTENHWLKKWAIPAVCYRVLKNIVPCPEDIKGINFTEGGANSIIVVSIHKRVDRTPRDIIYALLATRFLIWTVIVVDDDVDVYNPFDVERAWATRVVPDTDIVIAKPTGVPVIAGKQWGIDATVPLADRKWGAKAVPPGVDKVDYV